MDNSRVSIMFDLLDTVNYFQFCLMIAIDNKGKPVIIIINGKKGCLNRSSIYASV
jgi:hypothetical protein